MGSTGDSPVPPGYQPGTCLAAGGHLRTESRL